MNNPYKPAAQGTQDEDKDNTICAAHHHTQTTQARHDPFYKQLEVKTNRTSFLCGIRNGHHNTKLRTQRHVRFRT